MIFSYLITTVINTFLQHINNIVDMTDWERRQELFGFILIIIMLLFVIINLVGLCLHVSRVYYIDAKMAIQARTFRLNADLAKTYSVAQKV